MEYKLNDANFEEEVLKADIPVLVDVFATWCGPCQMVAPIVSEIAEEYDGKVKVGKLDSDENPNTAVKYGVRYLPTLLIFKNGEVAETLVGLQSKADIAAALDKTL